MSSTVGPYLRGSQFSDSVRLWREHLEPGARQYFNSRKRKRSMHRSSPYRMHRTRTPYRTRIISPSYLNKISHVGRPMGRATTKRHRIVQTTDNSLSTRLLYSRDISNIPRTSTGNPTPIDGRLRELINFRGVKVDLAIRNTAVVTSSPMVFHWAVVHDKGRADPALLNNNPLAIQNFFRGNEGSRGVDFIDQRSGSEINTLPINPDLYVTLRRGKRILQPRYATANGLIPSSSAMISEYIPINRQITFDDGEGNPYATDGRIFLAYWCEELQGAASASISQNSALLIDKYVVAYFDEPNDY